MRQVQLWTLDTPSLGDRSHLLHDGRVALVVDPQRDIDRVLGLADREGVRITHVLETHIHNDYVTGGLALARRTGAAYLVSAADDVAFDRIPVHDGDVVDVGDRIRVRALHTPGHTFHHLAYAVERENRPVAVFTGGSLLYGATGRPDLIGPEHRRARAPAARVGAETGAAARRHRGLPHPRIRKLLRRRVGAGPAGRLHDRPRETHQPRALPE